MQQDHKRPRRKPQESVAQDALQQGHQRLQPQEDPVQQYCPQFPEDDSPFAANAPAFDTTPAADTAKQQSQHALQLSQGGHKGPPQGQVPAQSMLSQPSTGQVQVQELLQQQQQLELPLSSSLGLSAISSSPALFCGLQSGTPSPALTASGILGAADSSAQLLLSDCSQQLGMPGNSLPSEPTAEAQLARAVANMCWHRTDSAADADADAGATAAAAGTGAAADGAFAAAAAAAGTGAAAVDPFAAPAAAAGTGAAAFDVFAAPAAAAGTGAAAFDIFAGPAAPAAGPAAPAAQGPAAAAPISRLTVATVVAQEAAEALTPAGSAPSTAIAVHAVTAACIGLPAVAAAEAAAAAAELAAVTQPAAAAAAAAAVAEAAEFAADIAMQRLKLWSRTGALVVEVNADGMEVGDEGGMDVDGDSTWQEGYIALRVSEDSSCAVYMGSWPTWEQAAHAANAAVLQEHFETGSTWSWSKYQTSFGRPLLSARLEALFGPLEPLLLLQ